MLTDQDIDKLLAVLATKSDVEEIRGDLGDLTMNKIGILKSAAFLRD